MATADTTWPTDIPQAPVPGGYREVPGTRDLRSNMDIGPAKVRRRYTSSIRTYEMVFDMTSAELVIFDAFWETAGLLQKFDFTNGDPRTNGNRIYRFVDKPEITPIGIDWLVAVKLEALP